MGRGSGKKLVYGVGISDSGGFARNYVDEFGKHRSTKEYSLWFNMLKRCYSEKCHLKKPTYIGCSVSETFKSFQYFAGWSQNQIGFKLEGYQLDKDLILKGNEVYGENTCAFIPRNINMFLTSRKAARGEFPVGIHLNKGKYRAQISNGKGVIVHLGYYSTPELAFQSYKTAKEAMAKELAIQYEGLVDPRVIVALNNYVVNIGD